MGQAASLSVRQGQAGSLSYDGSIDRRFFATQCRSRTALPVMPLVRAAQPAAGATPGAGEFGTQFMSGADG